jgi:hypothetical protein
MIIKSFKSNFHTSQRLEPEIRHKTPIEPVSDTDFNYRLLGDPCRTTREKTRLKIDVKGQTRYFQV